MYEFHYNYIKNKDSNNSRLLFTETEDAFKDFSNDKEMFEFSNYSTKSKYYNNSNKLVVGKMKDKQLEMRLKNLSY